MAIPPTEGSKTQKRKATRAKMGPRVVKKKGGGLNEFWGGVLIPGARPGSHHTGFAKSLGKRTTT
jgi:hypothetical protein